MLNISAKNPQGSIADAIRSARDVPARVLPYAASTALTRVARLIATEEMPAEMRRVFQEPVRWTLNSLRIKPATRETLSARVFVKDDAPSNGTRPEDYLLPQVEGGGRKEKRFERSMRYAGLLPAGWRAMPGQGAPLNAAGNFTRGEMQRILTATRSAFDMTQNKTNSAKSRRNAKNAPYFGITPSAGAFTRQGSGIRTVYRPSSLTPGVYKREGRSIKPVLIFTKTLPQYRPLLDFDGVSQRAAQAHFPREFARAAADITARRS